MISFNPALVENVNNNKTALLYTVLLLYPDANTNAHPTPHTNRHTNPTFLNDVHRAKIRKKWEK